MKPLAVETGTQTHLPLVRTGLSGRAANLRLFAAVLCVISGLAVCMFWLTAGNTTGAVGQNSNVLVSAFEYETISSTTLAGFVDHMPHRSGTDQSGDEIPSPVTEQPADASAAEDDTHKIFGLTVSFGFLASPTADTGSKHGFVIAEPNVTGGDPVTLLRGPPPEK